MKQLVKLHNPRQRYRLDCDLTDPEIRLDGGTMRCPPAGARLSWRAWLWYLAEVGAVIRGQTKHLHPWTLPPSMRPMLGPDRRGKGRRPDGWLRYV